jgi:hypothetical protein
MPIDSSVLLQATQPQLPNPLDMATKGLTLGNLATSNAMNQYQLQAVQDLPAAMQLASSYKNPSDAMPEIMQKFPRAAAQVAGLIKQWELTQAQTEEAKGKGAASRAEAYKGAMTLVGNQANGIINQSEPLTPFQKQSLAAQAQHAATIGGYDPGQLPIPPVMAQDIDWKRFAQGLASAATTPEQAATIREKQTVAPTTAFRNTQEGNLAGVNAGLAPQLAQYKGVEAGAAASRAQTERMNLLAPTFAQNPATGGGTFVSRFGPNGPSANVAFDAQGNPAQTGTSPAITAQAGALKDRLTAIDNNTDANNKLLQVIPSLRNALQAAYTGGVWGSDSGLKLANIASALPVVNGLVDPQKLAQAKTANEALLELMGPLGKQIGGARVTNAIVNMIRQNKPGTENALPSAMAMLDYLGTEANNQVGYGVGAHQYLRQNPTDLGLSGYTFKPQAYQPAQSAPKTQNVSSLPDPAAMPGKWAKSNTDGTWYRSVNGRWETQ